MGGDQLWGEGYGADRLVVLRLLEVKVEHVGLWNVLGNVSHLFLLQCNI